MLVKADLSNAEELLSIQHEPLQLSMKPIRTSTTLPLKPWTISNHDLHDQIAPTTRLLRKGTQSV